MYFAVIILTGNIVTKLIHSFSHFFPLKEVNILLIKN